jgi:pimeloyl-ACP methyl ester carboxylesterase
VPFSDADDLVALLDYLGIERAHLVGLSLGGRIALDAALTHPARVRSLVLAGPGIAGFQFDNPEGDQRIWETIQAARDLGPEAAAEKWLADPLMAPAMAHPDLAPLLRRLAFENAHDWLGNPVLQRSPKPPAAKRLAEIAVPTLAILGDRDMPSLRATVEAIATTVPGARKVVIAGAGHMVSMERPEEFNRETLAFLKSVGR